MRLTATSGARGTSFWMRDERARKRQLTLVTSAGQGTLEEAALHPCDVLTCAVDVHTTRARTSKHRLTRGVTGSCSGYGFAISLSPDDAIILWLPSLAKLY